MANNSVLLERSYWLFTAIRNSKDSGDLLEKINMLLEITKELGVCVTPQ